MPFPIDLNLTVPSENGDVARNVTLNSALTVLVGPNGSGKTHIMRSMKPQLRQYTGGKPVRFLSAGRMGLMERYRSDHDGQRGGTPNYDGASFGGKSETQRRTNFETLNGDFHTLAARQDILIKVSERLRKLFRRDISIVWDAGTLKVEFRHQATNQNYSSAREASGLVHLVGLLAALYDDTVGALLIDEPEVSLHPQLQAFLLREIKQVAAAPEPDSYKKIIVLSTHSTEFIDLTSCSDLPNFVFCQELGKEPKQVSPDEQTLNNRKLGELITRMGQEHKLALFAKSPLLVEGPSDSIICGGLANKLDIHIEAGGSQLLPVIGKGEFPTVVKLMQLMGKNPLVLADADAFTDDNTLSNVFLNCDAANTKAVAAGHASAMDYERNVRSRFAELVASLWEDIRPLAERTRYWQTPDVDIDEAVRKRRSAFSALFQTEAVDLPSDEWKQMREQLEPLLDLLEDSGCFILRRGTIEDYYQTDGLTEQTGKPQAAANEVNSFGDAEALETAYSDVIRCIKAASQAPAINEAELVRDFLLSIASVALEYFKSGKTAEQIKAQVRTAVGERANLFKIEIEDEKLKIDLESQVLKIDAFPIIIEADANVNQCIPKALGLTD